MKKYIYAFLLVSSFFCINNKIKAQTCPTCTFVTKLYVNGGSTILSSTTPNNLNCNNSYDVNRTILCNPSTIDDSNVIVSFYDNANNTPTWLDLQSLTYNILTIPANVTGNYFLKYTWSLNGNVCGSVIYPVSVSCIPPPVCPCPTVIEKDTSLGGHCAIIDTITNLCSKKIVSWTMKVNGQTYTQSPLTPQNIPSNTSVRVGPLLMINIGAISGTILYTFTYSDGANCTVTKSFDFSNCIPVCSLPNCNAALSIKRGNNYVIWNSGIANQLQLTCDSLYLLNQVLTCPSPGPTNFSVLTPTVIDNFNQAYTWPNGSTTTSLTIPSSWPANRVYTVTYKWQSNTDITCAKALRVQFKLLCYPCGSACVPEVTVINGSSQQSLVAGTNYSGSFGCNKTYQFIPTLNCTPLNNAITIKQIKVFDVNNILVNTAAIPWLNAFVNLKGIGNLIIPNTVAVLYKIRYYYGLQNSICDSFTCVLPITCMLPVSCCANSYWKEKPTLKYKNGTKVLYTLDCQDPEEILIKEPKLICDTAYVITGMFVCGNNTACPAKVVYTLKDLTNNIILTANNTLTIPANLQGGEYVLSYKAYCGTEVCDSCTFEFHKDCVTNQCNCTNASYIFTPFAKALLNGTIQKIPFDCSTNLDGVTCNMKVDFGADLKVTGNCIPTIDVEVKKNGNAAATLSNVSATNLLSYTFTANATYTIHYSIKVNGIVCKNCVDTIFIADCVPICDCPKANCKKIQTYLQKLPNNNAIQLLQCGQTITLECISNYLLYAKASCQNGCMPTINASLVNNNTGFVTSYSNVSAANPINASFVTLGDNQYTLTYYLIINGVKCDSCKNNINVSSCPPPPCPSCTATSTSNNTSSTSVNLAGGYTQVNQSFTFSGLPANVTYIRAVVKNVIIYAVDANGTKTEDCLSCINNPAIWASIMNGGSIGNVVPKISMASGGVAGPLVINQLLQNNQNPRAIFWGNAASTLNITGPLQISFLLPPPSALSCCKRKGTICINFSFRDNECNECYIPICFDVDIK